MWRSRAYRFAQEASPPWVWTKARRSRIPFVGARPLHDLRAALAEVLPSRGTFVELGANDGLMQSNTFWLERDRGWSGVLIEPALNRFLELTRNRSGSNHFACCACVPFDYADEFVALEYADLMTMPVGLELIGIDPAAHASDADMYRRGAAASVRFGAQARPLSSVIDDSGLGPAFDFLSLDVEGGEVAVLGGVDHERHRFDHVLCETRDPSRVEAVLTNVGYELVRQLTVHDYLFVDTGR